MTLGTLKFYILERVKLNLNYFLASGKQIGMIRESRIEAL
jgi:hypothetical protein